MPKLTIDDLKKLATAHTVKGQRYREAAIQLDAASTDAFVLRQEARRQECIAGALQRAAEIMQSPLLHVQKYGRGKRNFDEIV